MFFEMRRADLDTCCVDSPAGSYFEKFSEVDTLAIFHGTVETSPDSLLLL